MLQGAVCTRKPGSEDGAMASTADAGSDSRSRFSAAIRPLMGAPSCSCHTDLLVRLLPDLLLQQC